MAFSSSEHNDCCHTHPPLLTIQNLLEQKSQSIARQYLQDLEHLISCPEQVKQITKLLQYSFEYLLQFRSKLAEIQHNNNQLQQQYQWLQHNNKNSQQYINNLLKQLQDIKILYAERVDQKQKQIWDLSASQEQMKMQCVQLDTQLHQQRINVQLFVQLNAKYQQICDQLLKMQVGSIQLNQKLTILQATKLQLQNKCSTVEHQYQEVAQSCEKLQQQNYKLRIQIDELEQRIVETHFISDVIKASDNISDQSKSKLKDNQDDHAKLKQIAQNYRHDCAKISNGSVVQHVLDKLQQNQLNYNITQNLNHNRSLNNIQQFGRQNSNQKSSEGYHQYSLKKQHKFQISAKKHQTQSKLFNKKSGSSILAETPKQSRHIRKRTSTQFKEQQKNKSYSMFKKQLQTKDIKLNQLSEKIRELQEQIFCKRQIITQIQGSLQMADDVKKQQFKHKDEQIADLNIIITMLNKQIAKHKMQCIQLKIQSAQQLDQHKQKMAQLKNALKQNSEICQQYQQMVIQARNKVKIKDKQLKQVQMRISKLQQQQTYKRQRICISRHQLQLCINGQQLVTQPQQQHTQTDPTQYGLCMSNNHKYVQTDENWNKNNKMEVVSVYDITIQQVRHNRCSLMDRFNPTINCLSTIDTYPGCNMTEVQHMRNHHDDPYDIREFLVIEQQKQVLNKYPVITKRTSKNINVDMPMLASTCTGQAKNRKQKQDLSLNQLLQLQLSQQLSQQQLINQHQQQQSNDDDYNYRDKQNIMRLSNKQQQPQQLIHKRSLIAFQSILHKYKNSKYFKQDMLKLPFFSHPQLFWDNCSCSSKVVTNQIAQLFQHSGRHRTTNLESAVLLIKCYQEHTNVKDTLLMWPQGMLSQNQGQGLLRKKNKQKSIQDPMCYMLGNCEIVVDGKSIKTRRANKKNYFFGNLKDTNWYIISVRLFQLNLLCS